VNPQCNLQAPYRPFRPTHAPESLRAAILRVLGAIVRRLYNQVKARGPVLEARPQLAVVLPTALADRVVVDLRLELGERLDFARAPALPSSHVRPSTTSSLDERRWRRIERLRESAARCGAGPVHRPGSRISSTIV
jgi:hypothetical protein